MNIPARTGPKGGPIATPSACKFMSPLNVKYTFFVQSVSISFISDLAISVEGSPLSKIIFNSKSIVYSKGTFVNKDFASKETIRYPVGTLIVHIFCTKSLVLETVYSELLRGDISFDKYLARLCLAVPILEIIGRSFNMIVKNQYDSKIDFLKRYVHDTITFIKTGSAENVLSILNSFHLNIEFTYETEVNSKLAFLDVLLLRESQNIITTVYRKVAN